MRVIAGFGVLAFALGAIRAAALPAVAAPADIHLVCDGVATVEAEQSTSASPDEVLIDITDNSGRIKLPDRLAPFIHLRSGEGWRQFSSIRIDETQIEGRFRITMMNPVSVSINRMTGHIDLTEVGASFSGTCQPYDSSAVRKF